MIIQTTKTTPRPMRVILPQDVWEQLDYYRQITGREIPGIIAELCRFILNDKRPTVRPELEKLSRSVCCRMTDTEWADLDTAAKDDGVALSYLIGEWVKIALARDKEFQKEFAKRPTSSLSSSSPSHHPSQLLPSSSSSESSSSLQ